MPLRWTKFLYSTTAPIVNSCDWPQVRQSPEDFMHYISRLKKPMTPAASRQQQEEQDETEPVAVHKKSFKLAQLKLPEEVQTKLTPKEIATRHKKAGTLSNQRSAAATAWIVHHPGETGKCLQAWAGHSCTADLQQNPQWLT